MSQADALRDIRFHFESVRVTNSNEMLSSYFSLFILVND